MSFANLNYIAIIVAAVVAFGISGLWYMVLFSKQWMDAHGVTEAEIKARGGPSPMPFIVGILANLVIAFVLAALMRSLGVATITGGIGVAIAVWVGFVITVIVSNNTFSFRKPALSLIDGGNWLAVFIVMGAIIGAFG